MQIVAKFEKVSEKQFDGDVILPKRATKGSAGYDFYCPVDIDLKPGEYKLFPTGVRCKIADGCVLQLYPRSGLGSKKGLQIRNTVGIIDSDYYYADNEGHIMAMLVNTGDEDIHLDKGTAFMQGIFVQYFITKDDTMDFLMRDDDDVIRTGGMGSTDKK